MRLEEGDWAVGRGLSPGWKAVGEKRAKAALAGLKRAAKLVPGESASFILRAEAGALHELALFPAFDCWLFLAESFQTGVRPVSDWEAHFPYLQNFAAGLALRLKARRKFRARIGPQGRLHLSGTPVYFEFGASGAGKDAIVSVSGGSASAVGLAGRRGVPRRLASILPSIWVESKDPIVLQPIRIHGVRGLGGEEEKRFVRALQRAFALVREFDRPLFEEAADFLRLIVPLENPKGMGSVSSSYRELRGAFCLSHSDDALLQAETIVHEFCHQKLNLLMEFDPLIVPGQSGEIFYSPLRPDPRRLSGMLLGAHAFVSVGRFLCAALSDGRFEAGRGQIELNAATRIFHAESMLKTLCGYASLTPLGEKLALRLWRETALLQHRMLAFSPKTVLGARKLFLEHAAKHRLGETGFHCG